MKCRLDGLISSRFVYDVINTTIITSLLVSLKEIYGN